MVKGVPDYYMMWPKVRGILGGRYSRADTLNDFSPNQIPMNKEM